MMVCLEVKRYSHCCDNFQEMHFKMKKHGKKSKGTVFSREIKNQSSAEISYIYIDRYTHTNTLFLKILP